MTVDTKVPSVLKSHRYRGVLTYFPFGSDAGEVEGKLLIGTHGICSHHTPFDTLETVTHCARSDGETVGEIACVVSRGPS